MKDEDKVKDWRSTGRRKGRRELFNAYVPYVCSGWTNINTGQYFPCGKTVKEPPKDAPHWFDELWPEENRVLTQLQVDHSDKNWENNELDNLNWRCPSCHKLMDSQTAVGVAQVQTNWW